MINFDWNRILTKLFSPKVQSLLRCNLMQSFRHLGQNEITLYVYWHHLIKMSGEKVAKSPPIVFNSVWISFTEKDYLSYQTYELTVFEREKKKVVVATGMVSHETSKIKAVRNSEGGTECRTTDCVIICVVSVINCQSARSSHADWQSVVKSYA